MSWRSIRINQFSSCAFCVENFVWKIILIQWPAEKAYYIGTPIQYPSCCAFCVENDFENDILNPRSPEEPYYIWAPKQFPSCAFCLENDFESTISWGTMLHLSTKSIHNTSLSPSSALTSGVSLSSLLTSPREFGSCKLCGQDFSIDSWLKMHIISKYQSNSQDLALSFFLVLWSLFSILRHLRGVWIGDLWKET